MDPKPRIAPAPDPEVSAQPGRRHFPAAEKLRILEEADQCTQPGQISALLRREGIYSALLANWRRIRDAEGVEGLALCLDEVGVEVGGGGLGMDELHR